jgi:hypothetical protein
VKLTTKIKDSIVDQAASEKFDTSISKAEAQLVVLVHKKAAEAGIIKFDDVPDIYKNYVGRMHTIRLQCRQGSDIDVEDPNREFCVPNEQRSSYSSIRINRDDYFDEEPAVIAYKQIVTQKYQFRKDVRDILAAINTDKQLTALCPELCKYLPSVAESNGVLVPIDLINRVRNQLK